MGRVGFKDRDKEWIYLNQKGKCGDCKKYLIGKWIKAPTKKYMLGFPNEMKNTFTIYHAQIHHIIPISEGGKHNKNNWILLCIDCHKKRHRHRG